ncbi:hypothetical protein [Franzmannia qiaohouensis]|uniref:Uncharacterized protein n=1 Tax=Franzmannia qiaohouensis TaxID=1329370 RepID=A0ABU1HBM0_9GAMM|nr:hypothetical protein [Halomonas qiaohouensis]MDR5904870.1 hypothetical protein [Halomonas qiaohouensis]
MEVEMLAQLIRYLYDFSKDFAKFRGRNRELADQALSALSLALSETRNYYRDIELGEEPNRSKEKELVRLWSEAAIPARHIDQELSFICSHKADFWVSPSKWKREEIIKAGIDLENVIARYRKMLTK